MKFVFTAIAFAIAHKAQIQEALALIGQAAAYSHLSGDQKRIFVTGKLSAIFPQLSDSQLNAIVEFAFRIFKKKNQ